MQREELEEIVGKIREDSSIKAYLERQQNQIISELRFEPESSEYYEALIDGEIVGRNIFDKLIKRYAQTDPAFVLAVLGQYHPAVPVVFKYLADKEYSRHKMDPFCSRRLFIHSHRQSPQYAQGSQSENQADETTSFHSS